MLEQKQAIITSLQVFCFAKCTYKCKHCSWLVPQLNGFTTPFSEIKSWIDRLLEQVDEVIQFTPQSGEVLLYEDLEKFIEYVLNNNKIFSFVLITNGTIIPRESLIPLMKHPKFLLRISDYGNLKQQATLIEFCEKNGINVQLSKENGWYPVDYRPHNRTKEELIPLFLQCYARKMCRAVYDGRLYHCGQMAAMVAAGLVKPTSSNSYSIIDDMGQNSNNNRYIRFALQEYSETCDFCSYLLQGAREVPSAEQEDRELLKSTYTIVSRNELDESKLYAEQIVKGKDWLEGQYYNYKDLYEKLLEENEQLRSAGIAKGIFNIFNRRK